MKSTFSIRRPVKKFEFIYKSPAALAPKRVGLKKFCFMLIFTLGCKRDLLLAFALDFLDGKNFLVKDRWRHVYRPVPAHVAPRFSLIAYLESGDQDEGLRSYHIHAEPPHIPPQPYLKKKAR